MLFHAAAVHPSWADRSTRTAVVGARLLRRDGPHRGGGTVRLASADRARLAGRAGLG